MQVEFTEKQMNEVFYLTHNLKCFLDEIESMDVSVCSIDELSDLSERVGSLVVRLREIKQRR